MTQRLRKRAIYGWKLARIIDAVGYNLWESFSAIVLTREIQIQEDKNKGKEPYISNSIYNIIELVGASDVPWEDAARNAVETASKTLRDLRIAEITKLDMRIEKGKVVAYRTRVNLSFK